MRDLFLPSLARLMYPSSSNRPEISFPPAFAGFCLAYSSALKMVVICSVSFRTTECYTTQKPHNSQTGFSLKLYAYG
jgi:hypothetical protein